MRSLNFHELLWLLQKYCHLLELLLPGSISNFSKNKLSLRGTSGITQLRALGKFLACKSPVDGEIVHLAQIIIIQKQTFWMPLIVSCLNITNKIWNTVYQTMFVICKYVHTNKSNLENNVMFSCTKKAIRHWPSLWKTGIYKLTT